jgi:hypothetical protein
VLSQQKCRLICRERRGKGVFLENCHCFVFEVVCEVFYFLGEGNFKICG